jgi:hypothetical protein
LSRHSDAPAGARGKEEQELITEAAILTCSICGEPSSDICIYCTKDSCRNHRCERCKRCSDCCECEIPLSAAEPELAPPPEESAIHEVPAETSEPVAEAQVQPAGDVIEAHSHSPEPAMDAPAQPSDPVAEEHAPAPEPFSHFYTPRPPEPEPGE